MPGRPGFTLLELVVSTGVLALVLPVVGGGLFQLTRLAQKTNAGHQAQAATRNAVSWLVRDVPMAQGSDLVEGIPSAQATFTWADHYEGAEEPHTLTYALSGGDLVRTYDGTATVVARGVQEVSFLLVGPYVTVDILTAAAPGLAVTDRQTLKLARRANS